jgi:diguanylate cyclase (GGDEF)-like protein/PAS domain S-box-containing protein
LADISKDLGAIQMVWSHGQQIMNHKISKQDTDTKSLNIPINRRTDSEVRTAIDKIQEFFFSHNHPEKVLSITLDEIVRLLDCEAGVCVFPKTNGELHPILEYSVDPIVSAKASFGIDDIADISNIWLSNERHIFRSKSYTTGIPSYYNSMFGKGVDIEVCAFFPIIVDQHMLALIVIVGKRERYNSAAVPRISPVLGATVCALQSGKKISYQVIKQHNLLVKDHLLSSLINHSPSGVLVIHDGVVILHNYAAAALLSPIGENLKLDQASMLNLPITKLFPRFEEIFQWSKQKNILEKSTRNVGPHIRFKQSLKRLDNSYFDTNVTVFRYFIENKQYTVLQMNEIASQQSSGNQAPVSTPPSSGVNDALPIGMLNLTLELNCTYTNSVWSHFTGLDDVENLGTGWIKAIYSEDLKFLMEDLYVCLVFENDLKREIRLITPLGKLKWVDFHASIIINEDSNDYSIVASVTDITEQRDYASRLKHLAERDHLTGLINRAGFDKKLQRNFEAAKTKSLPITVIFIDLDGFKYVNDTFGHHSGDLVLKEVSKRLLATLSEEDTVCRFGGDEFVILCKLGRNIQSVKKIATEILRSVEKPFDLKNQSAKLSASIGIATNNGNVQNVIELLKHADQALYEAKHTGKNQCKIFNEFDQSVASIQEKLLNELRQGLLKESFTLHFQPIIHATSKKFVGVEALLRFNKDSHTIVMPDRFIPLLEESGMIVNVGYWVIDEACKYLKKLAKEKNFPAGAYMSINVSAKQLTDEDFVEFVKASCSKYDVNPNQLVIEITESVMIKEPALVNKVLKSLREFGVKTALDDFGTGYSSMTYLQKFEFDIIKIDKSFVDILEADSYNMKIVSAIIALAASFNLKVTAEGVEQKGYIDLLDTMGVDNIQGYVVSKPKAYDQCLAFLGCTYH